MRKMMIVFMIAAMLTGCVSTDSSATRTRISREIIDLVSAACCEIVLLKPEENPEITYEKELPWDNIPYYIRSDKYFSIGTAFAVGPNELCTAQHVLNLDSKSRQFDRFFIRDAAGRVYEIDRILKSDNDRDVVFFTAQGKTFTTFFKLNKTFTVNQAVFTVGSALGEGIVIRDGLLIGTIPEEENGRWLYLKSSAGANPGNSGGPLLDAAGGVVGVVLRLKDNIVYSLPAGECDKLAAGKAAFAYRQRWRLANIVDELRRDHTFDIALPKHYAAVKNEAFDAYMADYRNSMGALIENNKATMFPAGKGSKRLLNGVVTSFYPEIIFENKDNRNWGISDTETKAFQLDREGKILAGSVAGFTSLLFQKPKDVTLDALFGDPKLFMDHFLKGINIPRNFGGEKIRITSFGEPFARETMTDRWGRKWFINTWFINYADQVLITFASPTPQGLVCFFKETSSTQMEGWLYDFKVLASYFYFSYLGTFAEWSEFFKRRDLLPEAFSSISFGYQPGDRVTLATKRLEISYGHADFPVNDDSSLSLTLSFFIENDKVVWDVRRIVMDKDKTSNDYFLVYREMKPDPELPEQQQAGWKQLLDQKPPITGKPYSEGGLTRLGRIHPKYMNGSVPLDNLTMVYVVYLGLEGSIGDEDMAARMAAMGKNVKIIE